MRRRPSSLVRAGTLLLVAAVTALGSLVPAQAQAPADPPSPGMTTITLSSGLPAYETSGGLDANTSFCVLGNSPSLTVAGSPYFSYTGPAMPPPASACLTGFNAHPDVASYYSTILPGTQWVSLASGASDSQLPPDNGPVYYVYDAEFMACPVNQGQMRRASLKGSMLADNGAAVYLNGTHLATTPYPLALQNNFVYPTSFSAPPPMLHAGLNVLDFVVEDASPSYTGLDYTVTVTVPTCGQVKICKTAGNGVPVGTPITFTVADPPHTSTTVTVPAGPAPGGYCVMAGAYALGSNLNVHEAIPPGDRVTDISVAPPARQVGVPNLGTGTVRARVGAGVTEVSYDDASGQTGFLEICKVAPPSSTGTAGTYTFTVGSQTVTVPAGACSPPRGVHAGTVVVAGPGGSMTACSTVPPANLIGCNFTAETATVVVAPGDVASETILTVTNGPSGTTSGGTTGGGTTGG